MFHCHCHEYSRLIQTWWKSHFTQNPNCYPLVNCHITMENHPCFMGKMGKPTFKWPFSIAMLNYQRVCSIGIQLQRDGMMYDWEQEDAECWGWTDHPSFLDKKNALMLMGHGPLGLWKGSLANWQTCPSRKNKIVPCSQAQDPSKQPC